MRYFAALFAMLCLVLSFLARSTGLVALLLLLCVAGTIASLLGFISNRVSANSHSQVYLPTAEERALLQKRNERLQQERGQGPMQEHRLEPGPAAPKRPPGAAPAAPRKPPSSG